MRAWLTRWATCVLGQPASEANAGKTPAPGSDKLVDQVFEHFLAAAGVACGFALFQHVGFEFVEAGLARLDLRADARVPDAYRSLRTPPDGRPCGSPRRFSSPRANASMPPMWAWNRSTGSKLSRRTLASKFTPPVVNPPIPGSPA